jgi:cell division protein FtsA
MGSDRLIAAGIDAGSAYVRCVAACLEDGQMRLMGFSETLSHGWNRGRISDTAALSASILEAVRRAEEMAGMSLESAVFGMGGTVVHGSDSRGINDFGRPREIDQSDLNRAVERAYRIGLGEDRMVLQLFPQDFTIDGRSGYRSPLGAVGARLDAHIHLITTSVQEHHSLIGVANQAYVQVEETVFEGIAAAYAAILPEDRRDGLALLDIGAQSSNLVAYLGDALVLSCCIPVGGEHFTRDVARGLRARHEDAERLKREYGSVVAELTAPNSFVEVPSPDGRSTRESSRKQLNWMLEARAEELFEFARRELIRAGMDGALMGGIVLTGGGARLNGMCDMAERVLNCHARNGLPVGILGWPPEIDDPAWVTVAGLAMYSARLKAHDASTRESAGLIGRLFR